MWEAEAGIFPAEGQTQPHRLIGLSKTKHCFIEDCLSCLCVSNPPSLTADGKTEIHFSHAVP